MAINQVFGSLLVLLTFAISAIAPAYGQVSAVTADRIRKQFEAPPEPKSTFDMEMFGLENRPVEHSYGIVNRGSRFIGPFYGSASLALNSLFGRHDKTRVRVILAAQSEEMRFFEVSHQEQLGRSGTTLQLSYNQIRSRPGFTFETATGTNLETESQELSFTLSHPFIRLHDENLTARASFLWHKTVTDFAFNALFDDRLRVAKLGIQYDFIDGFDGLNLLDVEISQGLDIFNATTSTGNSDIDTPTLSRILGRSDFTKLTAYASRLQRLPGDFSIFLAATGQYSRTQLLSSEEFGFGGEYFGRAFDFSEITGDHGAAGKVEMRYGRAAETPTIKDYQFYTFWDYGAVWRIDPVINSDAHHSKTGSSAGLGVRFNVTDNISGAIEIDKPLTRDVSARGTDGEKPRVFFRLSAKF